jgi:hypothetical protein
LQFEDEVLMLVDMASESLEEPPSAPELPRINMPDLAPPDIEIEENLDDVDYFED